MAESSSSGSIQLTPLPAGIIPLRNSRKLLPGPVKWYGGKGKMTGRISPLIPDTRIYCEPYGGAGAILCAITPRLIEVYNDIDPHLTTMFRVLQNTEMRERLRQRLEYTPYSLDEFRLALQVLKEPDADPVDEAWALFVAQNQGFGGETRMGGSQWGRVFVSSRGMPSCVSGWRNRVARINEWGRRLAQVHIDNRDAVEVIREWDSVDTTFYLDPPYVQRMRKGTRHNYEHEATDQDHRNLVKLIKKIKGCCVLSSYRSHIYKPLTTAGWQHLSFNTSAHSAARLRGSKLRGKGSATKHAAREEILWLNPAAVEALGPNLHIEQ